MKQFYERFSAYTHPNLHRFNMLSGIMIYWKLIPRFRSLWCHQRPGKLTTSSWSSYFFPSQKITQHKSTNIEVKPPICLVTYFSVTITLAGVCRTKKIPHKRFRTDGGFHNTTEWWYPFITAWMIYRINQPVSNCLPISSNADSKVYVANMGPIWGQQNPGGPHVGQRNLAIRDRSV